MENGKIFVNHKNRITIFTLKLSTIMWQKFLTLIIFLYSISAICQVAVEKEPPYNIKTVAFIQDGNSEYPFFSTWIFFSTSI